MRVNSPGAAGLSSRGDKPAGEERSGSASSGCPHWGAVVPVSSSAANNPAALSCDCSTPSSGWVWKAFKNIPVAESESGWPGASPPGFLPSSVIRIGPIHGRDFLCAEGYTSPVDPVKITNTVVDHTGYNLRISGRLRLQVFFCPPPGYGI